MKARERVVLNAPPARMPPGNRAALRIGIRVAYVVAIGFATLANLDFSPSTTDRALREALDPVLTPRAVADFIRNVVLFAGWGMVWAATSPTHGKRSVVVGALISGALLSGAVESLQLFSARRQPSILDVISNTAGAWLGALVFVTAVRRARAARGRRSFVGVPAFLFAAPYALLVLLNAFAAAGRQDRLPVWGGPLERFRAALAQMEPGFAHGVPWLDAAMFLTAGVLGVAALAEAGRSYRRAALVVTVLGIVVVAAELARGFAGYSMALGPPWAHAIGLAAGAWGGAMLLPKFTARLRGPQRPRALIVLLAGIALLWGWRPFQLDLSGILGKLSGTHLVPLAAYLDRVDLFTAADVLISFLLFVPIGGLLAVWPLRSRGWLRNFLPGVYLAALIEIAQVAIAGRWFDITDVLVQCAAVALGWVIVHRAGFRPYGTLMRSSEVLHEKRT